MKPAKIREGTEETGNLVIDRTETQIVERRPAELEARVIEDQPTSILALISKIGPNLSIEAMNGLYALYERDEARKAERAFHAAMAAFKAERPPIVRRRENSQFKKANRDGVMLNQRYASLEDIEVAIGPTLAKHGLSYAFGDCKVEGGYMTMPCIISHVGGHSISRMSMPVPIESKAGSSDQQKMGSAQTYAMRYGLKASLGLTDVDEDLDGAGPAEYERIDFNQVANLQHMLDEINANAASRVKFLARFSVQKFEDIPKARYLEAVKMIEERRKGDK